MWPGALPHWQLYWQLRASLESHSPDTELTPILARAPGPAPDPLPGPEQEREPAPGPLLDTHLTAAPAPELPLATAPGQLQGWRLPSLLAAPEPEISTEPSSVPASELAPGLSPLESWNRLPGWSLRSLRLGRLS